MMKKHAKLITASLLFALTALLVSCGVQLQAVGGGSAAAAASTSKASTAVKGESRVVYKFFDEDFVSGGYQYIYPDASKVEISENEANVKNGEASLQFDLVADDFSGGAVCLYNLMYDLTPYYAAGALQFWVKGAAGGEKAWAALSDDETGDGKKSVVRVDISKYGGITNDWTLISIPLADFGKRGVFWDAKARVEVPEAFQWDKVTEFRLEIKKNENPSFRVWIDDISIVSDVFETKSTAEVVYWDDREETLPGLPTGVMPAGLKEIGRVLNKGDAVPGGFTYVYGGKTAYKVQETEDKGGSALALYMDQSDYSGVTVSVGEGRYINLERHRKTPSAGLAFWGKSGPGTVNLSIGVMDNQGKDVKTQTKLFIGDYGDLNGEWKFYMIPIRMFNENGLYWDSNKNVEVNAKVDWSKIQEVRISVNRNDERNRNIQAGEPAVFYVSDIMFIEEIPGYVNPEDYWDSFTSNAPDFMLHNFESDAGWSVSNGPKSEGSFAYGVSGADNGGAKSLHMTYRLNDWVDIIYNYSDNGRSQQDRDWTKYWGIKFDFYTDKPYQPITVQIQDSGNEIFVAASGGNKGWSEVIVPFRNFTKFPYYQPPEAVQNGKFDLDNIYVLDFKPAGEGSRGTFRVDNIRLTNDRAAKVKQQPANISLKINGDLNKVLTKKINDGIFGINVALWDGDLTLPATEKHVKEINHRVLRYPGGLRADDDDWEDVLKKKDFLIDTDEYFDFMKKTNTEGMITVNFGTGTPEKAARWVTHANKTKKAGVKYWEIGNELYGAWHPNVTSGDDYGKRAREFAVQMKKADPTIKTTAVWMLDGEWNKETFVHLKDVVDGVNVHHYPQHAGQENDAGLLAAPQTLPDILGGVRKQIEEFGVPGKHYDIWLTEWNSVDFDPGPQTMGIVNALFVADYLGMLTKVNIEQASYWDVHNSITPEGGDYGYLSRRGAPDGDNVPRSSYWAFKMASHSLGRGSLLESGTGDDNVTSYLSVDGKKKSLMLINKYPKTVVEAEINVPNFAGKAKMELLTAENSGSPAKSGKGPSQSSVDVKPGMKISLPAYSVTTITVE